jgi:hypothetical protein
MNVTITSKAINNGKQHIVKVPFVGTFTVDQKDINRTCEYVLSHGRNECKGFLRAVAIDSLTSRILQREKELATLF